MDVNLIIRILRNFVGAKSLLFSAVKPFTVYKGGEAAEVIVASSEHR